MILNLEQMCMITRGAVRVEEEDGYFRLFRFTEAQHKAYEDVGNRNYINRSFATAGIRLAFRTDSARLAFDYRFEGASSRAYAYFDVYENGQMIKHFGVEGTEQKSGHLVISLHEGLKDVELYLPWTRRTDLANVELDDGATLQALCRKYTMIHYGDSITQGYDALYPSLSYASQIARLMDADAVNKAIGGDRFFPELLAEPDNFSPDFITVAYGTNDWTHRTQEMTLEKARAFYSRLSEIYPNTRIFAVTPICRLDAYGCNSPFAAPLYTQDAMIRELCADLKNVTVINGWTLVPALKEFFADMRLHPNDIGFGLYAENLYKEIVKTL